MISFDRRFFEMNSLPHQRIAYRHPHSMVPA